MLWTFQILLLWCFGSLCSKSCVLACPSKAFPIFSCKYSIQERSVHLWETIAFSSDVLPISLDSSHSWREHKTIFEANLQDIESPEVVEDAEASPKSEVRHQWTLKWFPSRFVDGLQTAEVGDVGDETEEVASLEANWSWNCTTTRYWNDNGQKQSGK